MRRGKYEMHALIMPRGFALRSLNRWPGGSRVLPCLNCGATIVSASKAQRLCAECRVEDRRGSARVYSDRVGKQYFGFR